MLAAVPLPIPFEATVTKIPDGDTIKVTKPNSAEEITIRFGCVDAPEKDQLGGAESVAHLRSVLPIGAVVQILPISQKDRYGRQPAFVIYNKMNVSVEQVTAGEAWVYTEYLKTCPQYVDILNEAQDTARLSKLGLWNFPSPCPPWQWRANQCMPLPDCKPTPQARAKTIFQLAIFAKNQEAFVWEGWRGCTGDRPTLESCTLK